MKEYIDFEFRITPLESACFAISVHGPGGDGDDIIVSPLNDPACRELMTRLARFDTDEVMLEELGQVLFRTLFPSKVHEVFVRSQGMLRPDQGLRLRLIVPTANVHLAALPWEFLYDPNQGPLALLDTAVMRYLPHSSPIPNQETSLPLKVLLSAAQSPTLAESEHELREVETVLSSLGQHIQISVIPHLTRKELQWRLREGFHIWHFVGHGGFGKDGKIAQLYVEDALGGIDAINAMELNILLHRSGLRLVVLDACDSARLAINPFCSIAPALIRAQVPAVVAMQFTIPKKATKAFVGEFYQTLVEGFPLDACVTEGRKAIMNATGLSKPDWGIPVVYTRAPNGRLFNRDNESTLVLGPPLTVDPPSVYSPPEPVRPPEIYDFVGRANELAFFMEQLATIHLAVITGLAGVGKTTLAAALARQTNNPSKTFWHTFHKGEGLDVLAWNLAGFLAWNGQADVWQLLQSFRRTGGQPPPPTVIFDYLIQMLRGKNYLLCFDDFHLVDDNPLVDQFFGRLRNEWRAGIISVIIISRRVPDIITESPIVPLGGLKTTAVRRLLTDHGLVLTDEVIAQLVDITDGNAQLLMLSFNALRQTSDSVRVLSSLVKFNNIEIERFLMHEVDAGLMDVEREVMSAMAVLMGYESTQDVIEAILDRGSMWRVLHSLTQRHLLTVSEGETSQNYVQHAIVQAFYYKGLGRRARQKLHKRAGDYYATVELDTLKAGQHFERAGEYERSAGLVTADIWAIINQGQIQTLRSLLEQFTAKQINVTQWMAISIARGQIYAFLGQSQLSRHSYTEVLTQLSVLADSLIVQEFRARACRGMAEALEYESPDAALEWIHRGLDEIKGASNLEEATLRLREGSILIDKESYADAINALEQSLRLLPIEASNLRASALLKLGKIYCTQSDIERGKAFYLNAIAIYQYSGNTLGMIGVRHNLGIEMELSGNWPGAAVEYRAALDFARRLGSVTHQVALELSLGILHTKQGDFEIAMMHLSKCLELARDNKLKVPLIYVLSSLADLHVRLGAWQEAAATLHEAEQLSLEMNKKDQLSEIYRNQALIWISCREQQKAIMAIEQSVQLAHNQTMDIEEGTSLRILGQVLLTNGQPQLAMESFKQSLVLLEGKDPYEAARTKVQLGRVLESLSESHQGKTLLQEARATFSQLGAKHDYANL